MIPCTDTCVTTSRVPYPILTNTHHMNASFHGPCNPYSTNIHPTPIQPSRRGRRSTIPPEIREQTRRLKKQNMERRRRACISDKMNALHNLALSIVGVDPQESPKVEKADILSMCYSVFEGIAKIAEQDPELKFRLHKLRSCLREPSTSTSNQSNIFHLIDDETTRSSYGTMSEDSCSRTNSPPNSKPITPVPSHHPDSDYDNKENQIPSNLCPTIPIRKRSVQPDLNSLPSTMAQWHSTPVNSIKHSVDHSSDSGFQSILDRSSHRSIPSNYEQSSSSYLAHSRLGSISQTSQDHRSCKLGSQNRSAFTPIRQTKTSFASLLPPPPPPPLLRQSLPSSSPSTAADQSRTNSTNTATTTTMWRPYLD